jgi:TPR repeat protein
LQLGATFDPIVLGRAGSVTSDPVQALSWYRRARELGMAEAEQRIKDLQIRAPEETDIRPR